VVVVADSLTFILDQDLHLQRSFWCDGETSMRMVFWPGVFFYLIGNIYLHTRSLVRTQSSSRTILLKATEKWGWHQVEFRGKGMLRWQPLVREYVFGKEE